jgi:hypothetical protein
MSSLISDSEKALLLTDFQQVVDTFLRPLVVYQEAQRTVIVSNPDYNPFSDWNQNNTDIQNTPVYTTISGRILWDKQQEWKYVRPPDSPQIKTKDATNRSVRLKVDPSGYNLLKDAKKVEIDGVLLDIESQARPHGLFDTNYYTFYFVRSM